MTTTDRPACNACKVFLLLADGSCPACGVSHANPCPECGEAGVHANTCPENEEDAHTRGRAEYGRYYCRGCADAGRVTYGPERTSLGIFAGYMCDEHWRTSGYRDEPASAFDPADAGETYEES